MSEIIPTRRGPGRPKGSKNKKTLLREELYSLYFKESEALIVSELKGIVKALVKKAKEGDVQAAKILLDRCIPARKAVTHSHDTKDINITINVNINISINVNSNISIKINININLTSTST